MKYMTIEHMKKLDNLKLNKYFIECMNKLEKINYENRFEFKKERYLKFIKHVYEVAEENKLTNKKYAFSLMLLWYVEGDRLTSDERFLEVLHSEKLSSHEKAKYFKHRAVEHMKGGNQ